jgi:hypothetical protein
VSDEIKPLVLTFGNGINSRNRPFDVDVNECVTGQNFDLDVSLRTLRRRPGFDLIATAPNGLPIRGLAQLTKRNGNISTLVQAGDRVYSWDTGSTFTSVGTVSANSRLRGMAGQNWLLDEFTIITDLARETTVKQWDGTTFGDFGHNLGDSFYAKYCRVVNERAVFGNVKVGTADTPHVLLASALSDAETLTNEDRPSSSLSEADAFFIPTPDLRPVNGLETGFGEFVISTYRGSLYQLAGSNARDFFMNPFYEQASVAGDEALVNIGNDVMMGLPGRIESLSGTLDFGDVETNDISLWIAPNLRNTQTWTIVYDRRGQRVFCFPDDQSVCWVMHKGLLSRPSQGVLSMESEQRAASPWSKWITDHSLGMQPSAVVSMLTSTGDPMICAGDLSGNLYRLDGSSGQDGGSADVTVRRRSGLFRVPDKQLFDFKGWINYTSAYAVTITLRFLFAGKGNPDYEFTVNLPANANIGVYSGNFYYNSTTYYGTEFTGRIARQDYATPGYNNYAQLEVEVSGRVDFDVQEIGIVIRTA